MEPTLRANAENEVRVEIFYADAQNGWCAAKLTECGYQIGHGAYFYHKADAIEYAKSHSLPIHIYGRDARFQRRIAT